jgi:hypothetical protein
MRHNVSKLEPELNEISDWVHWMESELTSGGVDVPGSETCLIFAASAIRLAHKVHHIQRHLPTNLRRRLIEASLLHQCWQWNVDLSKKSHLATVKLWPLPVLEAQDFLHSGCGGQKVMAASDGHEYVVRIPNSERKWALATEMICFEIARQLHLPTPPLALLLINPRIAARSGILITQPDCAAKGSRKSVLPCLGVKKLAVLKMGNNGKPTRPLSARGRSLLIGQGVLEILTFNMAPQEPSYVAPRAFAEPVFEDYSHCLADADWQHFLEGDASPLFLSGSVARAIRSFQQLDVWITRAERLDAEGICERVFKLPSQWYNGEPLMVAKVVQKLVERAARLRRAMVDLEEAGQFPNLRRPPTAVSTRPGFTRRRVLAMAN